MSELKQKLEEILQEKNDKIIPNNFSQNLQIFGVNGGLYEGDYYGGVSGSNISYINNMLTFSGGTGEKQIVGTNNVAVISYSDINVANAINLTANKIKKNEVVLGITGNYEGSGGGTASITLPSAITFANSDITNIPDWFMNADATNLSSMNSLCAGCNSLQTVNLKDKNYPNMGNFYNAFAYCFNLTSLDMSNVIVNDLSNLSFICTSDVNLTTANLSGMQFTRATTYLENCFRACSNLVNISMDNITYSVDRESYALQTNMMFAYCYNLPSFNLGVSANNSISLSGYSMFLNCRNLQTVNLNNIDMFYNVTGIFNGCNNLTDIVFNPNAYLGVRSSSFVSGMFNGCTNLSNNTLTNITNLLTRCTNNYVGNLSYLGITENQCYYIANLSDYTNILHPNGWRTGYSNIDNASDPDRAFIGKSVSLRISNNMINDLNTNYQYEINDILSSIDNRYVILGATAGEGSTIWEYEYTRMASDYPSDISSVTSVMNIVDANEPIYYNSLKSNYYIQFVKTEFMDDPYMGSGDIITTVCRVKYNIDIANSDSTNLVVMLDLNTQW